MKKTLFILMIIILMFIGICVSANREDKVMSEDNAKLVVIKNDDINSNFVVLPESSNYVFIKADAILDKFGIDMVEKEPGIMEFVYKSQKYTLDFLTEYWFRLCKSENYGSNRTNDYILLSPWDELGVYIEFDGEVYFHHDTEPIGDVHFLARHIEMLTLKGQIGDGAVSVTF